jgi:hypothetical protein
MANWILEELDDFIEETNAIGQNVTAPGADHAVLVESVGRLAAAAEVLAHALRKHFESQPGD